MPAIAIRGLYVRRGGKVVLPHVDAEVEGGRVTGLLGPSGSGKTTLMRAIVGVQIVDGGTVEVLGEPAGAPQLRTRVAYITQPPSVYADLTVRENLRYFARILDVSLQRVDHAIETVDLGAEAEHVVDRLSGGERARVSLATALLGEPEVLVLDEPTFGQDAPTWREVVTLLAEQRAAGRAIAVVTHDADLVDVLADERIPL